MEELVGVSWGNGVQLTPLAPFICTGCASLLLLDIDDHKLYDPDDITHDYGIDVLALMMRNPAGLWKAIEEQRAVILAQPGLRPVKPKVRTGSVQ